MDKVQRKLASTLGVFPGMPRVLGQLLVSGQGQRTPGVRARYVARTHTEWIPLGFWALEGWA